MSLLGKRLKYSREKNNFSQLEAAKKLGISNGTLSGYERDYRDPDTKMLEKMADLYGVTTDYLLGRSDTPDYTAKEDQEFKKAITDPDLKRWHSELPESDEEDLKKLKMMWDIIKSDKNNKK